MQESIYKSCVAPLVESCFEGYNATVLVGPGMCKQAGTRQQQILSNMSAAAAQGVDHLFAVPCDATFWSLSCLVVCRRMVKQAQGGCWTHSLQFEATRLRPFHNCVRAQQWLPESIQCMPVLTLFTCFNSCCSSPAQVSCDI